MSQVYFEAARAIRHDLPELLSAVDAQVMASQLADLLAQTDRDVDHRILSLKLLKLFY